MDEDISDLADLSELSREQILEKLAPRIAKSRGDSSFDGKCKFLPSKGPQLPCPPPAATAWGFCSKHSRTAQGRGAQLSWKESAKAAAPKKKEIEEEEMEEEAALPKKMKIKISRNKSGRYCDTNTGLCFDGITKAVIGYQEVDGTFRGRLTAREKEYCRNHGLSVQESKTKAFSEETSFVRRPIKKEEPIVKRAVRFPEARITKESLPRTRAAASGAGRFDDEDEEDYPPPRRTLTKGKGIITASRGRPVLKQEDEEDRYQQYGDEDFEET
jgi:hypothetical protein